MRKIIKAIFFTLAALALLLFIFWKLLILFPDPLTQPDGGEVSVAVKDRNNIVLKEFLSAKDVRKENRSLADFSPHLIKAVLAGEDKRFYHHPGFDPLAMVRAFWLNVSSGEIKSGASTITMQLARLSQGLSPGPKTISRKLKEVWWALLIERHHSKEEILVEYLNRAPCGNLAEGFGAASQVYLGKSAQTLSPAEAAFLSGLPSSPGALNPYKDPRPALKKRGVILRRMAENGDLGPAELERALEEPLALNYKRSPFKAPHFVSYFKRQVMGKNPPAVVISTLDLPLQEKIEKLVEAAAAKYAQEGLNQAAVLVMSLPEGEILAWVGSADFFDEKSGQNDGVIALRQPGSALKPFIYALAFETGLIAPASLIDDSPADYSVGRRGSFSPSNYSGNFHGPVSARLALASSLNLPAVKVIDSLGVGKALERLNALGLSSLNQEADHYGIGLVLGGGEVTLFSLTNAYAALARGGLLRPPVFTLNPRPALDPGREAMNPGAAFLVSDILSDDKARATGFGERSVLATPYPSYVKTGTSKNFRDNWCVGYTSDFVVGVWAGNFEANPMDKVSGVTGAGYLWREVSDLLAKKQAPEKLKMPFNVTRREVCPITGLLRGPACPGHKLEFFLDGHTPSRVCRPQDMLPEALGVSVPVLGLSSSFRLIRPLNGELYALDPGLHPDYQRLKAMVQIGPEIDELAWRVNGRPLSREKTKGPGRKSVLIPLEKGSMEIAVTGYRDGRQAAESRVRFLVK